MTALPSYLSRLALSAVLDDPGCMALLGGDRQAAQAVVSSALDGLAEQIAAKDAAISAWRRIAVRVAQAGDGSYRLLSTADRDALERAVTAVELAAIADTVENGGVR